ncbi:hypothetical protein J3E69DRAFT_353226 [Trichoderma sp. SZMC 28015]
MLCIEQKAAYFRTTVPYLLISGICDYADSHKNEIWQDYAIANAVACAKGIVEYIPSQSTEPDTLPLRSSQVDPFRWLSAIDYQSQLDHNLTKCAPGTCQWFLESEPYREWCNLDGKALLLHGPPGSGKSMMASKVLDHLSTTLLTEKSAVFCYAFCNFYRANEERAENIMCNLLKQLCQIQSPLPPSVEDLFARHRSQRTQLSLDEAASALRSIISAYSKAFIVVDGLDECEPSSASQFVSKILDLLVDTRANFFATSRSLPSIVGKFREHNSIIIDMPSDSAAYDIGQYIKSNAKRLPDFVNHSPDVLEQATNTIIECSDGLFRNARFLLDSIVDSKTAKSMMRTLKKQSRRYDTLDAVMTRIRGQEADRRDLAMNTLLWMTYAYHPLRTKQLQHALAVEIGESSLDEANILDADDIASVCAGLVVIDTESDTFRFCNKSVESWIIERRSKLFPDAWLYITRACLTYLSFTAFESGIALSEDDLNSRFQQYPLYIYAAFYWGHYAFMVPECPDILLFLGKRANAAAAAQVRFLTREDQYVALPEVSVAIHLAASFGLKEAMKVLLNVFDVNLKAHGGLTPLMVAAMSTQTSMVELLLAEGADIEAKDDGGRTALSFAVLRATEEMVDLLITRGAKVNFHDRDGSTPLLTAIDRGEKAVVQLLLARGADIELESTNGETPAAYAAKKENEDIASLLLAERQKSPTEKSP